MTESIPPVQHHEFAGAPLTNPDGFSNWVNPAHGAFLSDYRHFRGQYFFLFDPQPTSRKRTQSVIVYMSPNYVLDVRHGLRPVCLPGSRDFRRPSRVSWAGKKLVGIAMESIFTRGGHVYPESEQGVTIFHGHRATIETRKRRDFQAMRGVSPAGGEGIMYKKTVYDLRNFREIAQFHGLSQYRT